MNENNTIIIFTDGSSIGNPGPGGWGALIVNKKMDELAELGGNKPQTTNNEMELTAVISALAFLSSSQAILGPIEIYTDSDYVIKGITQWIFAWQKNGWQTKAKQEVKNKRLWQQLNDVARGKSITWKHVISHVGVAGNERVDAIAQEFASGGNPTLFRGKLAEYNNPNITVVNESMINQGAGGASRAKGQGKAYSYLSLVDGVAKRHETWDDTKARVDGKDAKFRKTFSVEDEQRILEDWGASLE